MKSPASTTPRAKRTLSVAVIPVFGFAVLACVAPGAVGALDATEVTSETAQGGDAPGAAEAADGHASQGDSADLSTTVHFTRLDALALSLDECVAVLSEAHVDFETLDPEDHPGVELPLRLNGALDGVVIAKRGHDPTHEVIDCRLAVALLGWTPTLRTHGITRLEHYSIYRPAARTGRRKKVSGHARALAIDAARFMFADGRVLDVLEDWGAKEPGVDPCLGDVSEGATEDRTLRDLVCNAVARDLFSVVLTPHHDKAHDNHVHLELVPDVSWTYIR